MLLCAEASTVTSVNIFTFSLRRIAESLYDEDADVVSTRRRCLSSLVRGYCFLSLFHLFFVYVDEKVSILLFRGNLLLSDQRYHYFLCFT